MIKLENLVGGVGVSEQKIRTLHYANTWGSCGSSASKDDVEVDKVGPLGRASLVSMVLGRAPLSWLSAIAFLTNHDELETRIYLGMVISKGLKW